MDRGAWRAIVHKVKRSRIQLKQPSMHSLLYVWFSRSTERNAIIGQEDPLEKEMATHSSILACRIPWAEKPGGLQSTGSKRVGHD